MTKKAGIQTKGGNFLDTIGFFIIYLMVGLIPHIYKYTLFAVAESDSNYFKDALYADIYILAKSRMFLFLTISLLIVFIYQIVSKRISLIKDKLLFGTIFFGIVITLSNLMSDYSDLVYWGAKDRFEGMWVWLAYLAIFIITRHYAMRKKIVEDSLKVLLVSTSIMAIFGIMQVFGFDIYTEGILKWVCFPKEIAENISQYITVSNTQVAGVGALYNSNYFGVFTALGFVVSTVFCLNSNIQRSSVVLAGISGLNLMAVVASKSDASLLSCYVTIIYIFCSSNDYMRSNSRKIMSLLIMYLIILIFFPIILGRSFSFLTSMISVFFVVCCFLVVKIMGIIRTTETFKDYKKYYRRIVASAFCGVIILASLVFFLLPAKSNPKAIESASIEGNIFEYKFVNKEKVTLIFSDDGFNAYDNNNNLLPLSAVEDDNSSIVTNDARYPFNIKVYDNGYLVKFEKPHNINVFYDGKSLSYVDPYTGIGEIEHPNYPMFLYNKGMLFSSRAYIWSGYLSNMSDNWLIGHGADTYIQTFPQSDYIGKLSNFYWSNVSLLVDKPHSLFLDVLVSYGLLGLGMIMAWLVYYSENIIFDWFENNERVENICVKSIVIIILISGFFNDSTIPITIILAIFSGLTIFQKNLDLS
jgi:hypothetical protein